MTTAPPAMKPVQNWNKANDPPHHRLVHRPDGQKQKGLGSVTLRQFLFDNFGWDIYDWNIDDIRF